ncbi:hypothetical protein RQP46_001552 [Phenoliferia psychrophenolica]
MGGPGMAEFAAANGLLVEMDTDDDILHKNWERIVKATPPVALNQLVNHVRATVCAKPQNMGANIVSRNLKAFVMASGMMNTAWLPPDELKLATDNLSGVQTDVRDAFEQQVLTLCTLLEYGAPVELSKLALERLVVLAGDDEGMVGATAMAVVMGTAQYKVDLGGLARWGR